MEVLRLKLFQETACYKKPAAFKVGETYPLPPYSTVKGMLHQILQADHYIPMQICIQGSYESRIVDYQKHYFFKKSKTTDFPLITDGLALDFVYSDITAMPIYVHLLLNVQLVIHVKAEQEILLRLQQGIENGVSFSLGRWEDLVRVDECRMVEVRKTDREWMMTLLPIYWPVSDDQELSGVPYRLNWKYEIIQGIRQWKKIKVRYVQAGEWIEDPDNFFDPDGYPVIFPKEMEE
ncbi:type I-B CRISPR-associated protein Cas5b [Effusibacillus pohliae]|uniref:type I-B CRISPR-associated protein Cas5b n=1 Tax=Effusibacillus pohliae TaxID=232270 RepID=UPI00037A670F|nr:type I-B CRISPR-associated protein Cas5b [Effusibacillus pohliae]